MRKKLLAVLLASMFAANAWAENKTINIAPQDMPAALHSLASQTGIQLLFTAEDLKGIQAKAISGSMSAEDALARLLEGTNYTFTASGKGTYVIKAAPVPQPMKETEMSPIEVRGAPEQVTEMSPIQVRGTAPEKSYVEPVASTGTKTDTPIMETPLNIQVVPQQVLQDQKATTLDQVLSYVSGVRSKNLGGAQENIYLRGFLSTTTFRNGFRIEDDYGMGLRSMTNVESLEVLKGPAAILYGRVEPGGIVNVVTKQPQATPYYSIEQSVGSWDHYLTDFDATGPVNADKTVLYRINTSYDTTHSWRDSVQSQKLFIAPSLRWNVSPQTQVNLEVEYMRNPMVWDGGQMLPYDAVNNQIVALPRNQNLSASSPARGDTTYFGFNWSHQFNDDWSIKHQINRHEFKQYPDSYYWISGFAQVGNTWTVDRNLQQTDGHWTTTATVLDLTGHFDTAGLKHTLLVGADFYRREKGMNIGSSLLPSTTNVINPAPAALVTDPTMAYSMNNKTDSSGVYIQDQIKLPHDIQVLAGLRTQKVNYTGTTTMGTGQGGTGLPTTDTPLSDSAMTPRVGLLWQANDQLSLYGNYAENFGANTGQDWQGNAMKPESAKQKEIGAKAQFFGGKLSASLALFELTKTNVAVADLAHPGFSLAVGEIRSRGPEFDIQGEIQPGWNVMAAYTYTDIVVTKSTPGSTYTQGNRMANVPRNMVSFWTTYELKGEALHGWKVGGGVTGYSSATDATNTLNTPGYAVANAMASYEFKTAGHNKVTAQLNINNLFNKTYYTDLYAWGNAGYLQYGTPRSATASIKLEY